MIHFFNSLAILTIVGLVSLSTNVKTKDSQANIGDTMVEYKSSINGTLKPNTLHSMRQDKIHLYTDCKDSIL
ncbi:hypothetical protein I6I97_02735 [Sphingobacterium multivorum]|uniref:hypothetical protein n=1 Tax=Sphingobacterium multivorum TaxID=28454 RepID=UPI00191850E0|nr:hypothetical protein [Sphingobacterium multivorum]QQT62750.1 hypothetical protein I6I97_02735 [Sphingobacterium multivorum]